MLLWIIVVILSITVTSLGSFNVDLNRIKIIDENDLGYSYKTINREYRRSVDNFDNQRHRNNKLKFRRSNKNTNQEIKDYLPKQDPKLFYQSNAYLAELESKNEVNNEISSIYPGNIVENHQKRRKYRGKLKFKPPRNQRYSDGSPKANQLEESNGHCIKCPLERTLVAKPGFSKVLFQAPRLQSCSGTRATQHAKFVRMYGPHLGSLLEAGSHIVVGKIVVNGQVLQLCRFNVNVVTQMCPLTQELKATCDQLGQSCNITCVNTEMELRGHSTLICDSYQKWNRPLPFCRPRTWCKALEPPLQGHLSCQGSQEGGGLTEGSRCRARCGPGLRPVPRAAVCRRGAWSQHLTCLPRH